MKKLKNIYIYTKKKKYTIKIGNYWFILNNLASTSIQYIIITYGTSHKNSLSIVKGFLHKLNFYLLLCSFWQCTDFLAEDLREHCGRMPLLLQWLHQKVQTKWKKHILDWLKSRKNDEKETGSIQSIFQINRNLTLIWFD